MLRHFLAIGLVASAPSIVLAQLPDLEELALLTGSQHDTEFGSAVAISGNRLVIGAVGADGYRGSAYVFELGSSGWEETTRLSLADGDTFDRFGASVAIDGSVLAVGVPSREPSWTGAVYVYELVGTDWVESTHFNGSGAADALGMGVDLDGDRLVVGAALAGEVFSYVRSGMDWVMEAHLSGPSSSSFGFSVSLDGDTLAVGAPGDDHTTRQAEGAIYVYVLGEEGWTLQARLEADPGIEYAHLGRGVDLSGDTIVASAHGEDTQTGSAYVFERTGSSWAQVARLQALEPHPWQEFGAAVAIDGDDIAVGCTSDSTFGTSAGSVYWYQRSGGAWNLRALLRASDANTSDQLGKAVDVQNGVVFAGAEHPGVYGGVFVYEPTCGSVESYCPAAPNSTGQAAEAGALGHLGIAGNDLTLVASKCPPNQSALFLYGPRADQVPFGDGLLCVRRSPDTPIYLYPVGLTGAAGEVSRPLDLAAMPPGGEILPGSTWHFQMIYRDPAAGGATFNLTNGLRMTFCP
jgi:hypothetical protein